MSKHCRSLFAIFVFVLSAGHSCFADGTHAEGSFSRILKVAGPIRLEIATGVGQITVRNGRVGVVQISASIRISTSRLGSAAAEAKVRTIEAEPPVTQNGSEIVVGYPGADTGKNPDLSISYELVVPADTQLRASCGFGNQTIDGLQGSVYSHTGFGNLQISNIAGNVDANTGYGNVRALGIGGSFYGHSGSGDIELVGIKAPSAKIETGIGRVSVHGVQGTLDVQTGTGEIFAQGTPVGQWRLRSGSGGITLQIPESAGFDLNARSGSGPISTTHPIVLTVSDPYNQNELRGRVHGGGALVQLNTGSGAIKVE